jgi:hypothetical protein
MHDHHNSLFNVALTNNMHPYAHCNLHSQLCILPHLSEIETDFSMLKMFK